MLPFSERRAVHEHCAAAQTSRLRGINDATYVWMNEILAPRWPTGHHRDDVGRVALMIDIELLTSISVGCSQNEVLYYLAGNVFCCLRRAGQVKL